MFCCRAAFSSPTMASTMMMAMTKIPIRANRCRRKRRNARWVGDSVRAVIVSAMLLADASGTAISGQPDSWIRESVEHVGDEVGEQHENGKGHRDAHDQEVVARRHGVHRELAQAWPAEDLLRDDGAPDHLRDE